MMSRVGKVLSAVVLFFAFSAVAQTVTGSGNTDYIPQWTGSQTLGNSPISVAQWFAPCTDPGLTEIYNVKCWGASGDGSTDDTNAIQSALTAAANTGRVSHKPSTVYFPPGRYVITAPISSGGAVTNMDIVGEGRSSQILWNTDSDVFDFTGTLAASSLRNLTFVPIRSINSARYAIYCSAGATQTLFENIYMLSQSGYNVPSGIFMGYPADTVTILNPLLSGITGTGIAMDKGSEVRIIGGRIQGYQTTGTMQNGTRGIWVRGNNGGVHVQDTDTINLQFGIIIENANGSGSNREIFISHATMDGCYQGLVVNDSSYVDVVGLWAASATKENVFVGFGSPLLSIAGGTIFNAGAIAVADVSNGANGMTINSGNFTLSGVSIRNNYNPSSNPNGRGLWVANTNVSSFAVTGCRIMDNGFGVTVSGGSSGSFVGNIFHDNPRGTTLGSAVSSANLTY